LAACAATACQHDGHVLRPDALRASGLPVSASVPESAPAFIPHPSVCAEERRARRIRASDCLSRRRVRARPRLDRAPQVAPRSASGEGSQTAGSPFLLLTFLLAKQKKSELPPGNPRLVGKPPAHEAKTASTSSARTVEGVALEDRLHGSRIKSGMTRSGKFCY
jgi:hypothetical protein